MSHIEWIKALSPIIVGFGGAYYGSILALNKFKKEKFWDERRNGYREVIDHLEALDCWAEITRAESYCEPSRTADVNPETSLRALEKYSKTGGILFSDDFQNILTKSYSAISKMEFRIHDESLGNAETEQQRREWHTVYALELKDIVSSALPKLVEIAKNDLPNKT